MAGETPAGSCRRAYTALATARDRLSRRRAAGRAAAQAAADAALRGAAAAAGEVPPLGVLLEGAGGGGALLEAMSRKLQARGEAACDRADELLGEMEEDIRAAAEAADALARVLGLGADGCPESATAEEAAGRPLFACLPRKLLLLSAREGVELLEAELRNKRGAMDALRTASDALHAGRAWPPLPGDDRGFARYHGHMAEGVAAGVGSQTVDAANVDVRDRLTLLVAAWVTDAHLNTRRLEDILRDADTDMRAAVIH